MKTTHTAVIQLPISSDHGCALFEDFLSEVQRRHQKEVDLKNAAFSFLVSKGLYSEFHQQLHSGTLRTGLEARLQACASFLWQESEVHNA